MTISIKRTMFGLLCGGMLAASMALAVPAAHAQLTSTQVSAIIALLQSFGADAATIANVQAALGGAPASGGVSCAFSRDLTIGASGADVSCLQRALIAKGHAIPAGATGYFGGQTQAALAAYQRASGIVPAIGYFGPITRATLAAAPAPSPAPSPSPAPRGDEGVLKNFSTIGGGVESEVEENERSVRVLGIEFDADDSDMRITRIDVDFEKTGGAGSPRLDRYVSAVSLWLDDDRIATLSVERASRDDDVYSFRFSNLNEVVREDETGRLYVAVDAVRNIDSADEDAQWTVTIPARGIRATDTAGISDTYAGADLSETFSFGEQSVGTLRLSAGSGNSDDVIVAVEESRETRGVALLEFELRARTQDVVIEDFPVSIAVGGSVSHAGDIVRSVKLMQGSREIKSKNVPANAGLYEEIVFDNLDLTINEGDTETFRVVADLRKQDGSFQEGDTLSASTTASMSGWEVEDANGEDVDPTGSVTGGTLHLFVNGISVAFVSVSETVRTGTTGNPDVADFTIVFDVTAVGDEDVYIEGDIAAGGAVPGTGVDGLMWATTTGSTVSGASAAPILTASGSSRGDDVSAGSADFLIESGETRRFTFRVTIPADSNNDNAGVMITGIKWGTIDNDDVMDRLYTFNLHDLKTRTVTGLYVR